MTEKWTLRRRLGYRLYSVRYEWRHFWRETLPWKLAWLVPRKIALFVFVRVYGATWKDCPGDEYGIVYKGWEQGNGR